MRGVLIYTGLRLALFVAVWIVVQLVTPWRGLLAIAVAIIGSGVIGFFLLDRPRDAASTSVWHVFRRIDDRIQRNALEEDAIVEATLAGSDAGGPDILSTEGPSSTQRKPQTQEHPEQPGEQAGDRQYRDQVASGDPVDDTEAGTHRQGQ